MSSTKGRRGILALAIVAALAAAPAHAEAGKAGAKPGDKSGSAEAASAVQADKPGGKAKPAPAAAARIEDKSGDKSGDKAKAAPEDQAGKDLAFLRECLDTLAARGAPARACIDIVAKQCGSEAGGESTAGALACEEREGEAWSTLLGEATGTLQKAMSNTERDRFAEAQDAWGAYRDAECAYEAARQQEPAQQSMDRASCLRRLIAARTIALHERQAEIEDDGDSADDH
jgi:uncharacterized protein YecT (DUF1311 family)